MSDLAAALVAALKELSVVERGRRANAGSYSYEYADIADVVKLTRPKLAEHGIVALTPVHGHESGLAVTVTLLHSSGEKLEFPPFPFPHGRDAQATGSMVTYHRRYALVAALGMAAGDDDDGASAHAQPLPAVELITAEQRGRIKAWLDQLDAATAAQVKAWWHVQELPSAKTKLHLFTREQAQRVIDHMDAFKVPADAGSGDDAATSDPGPALPLEDAKT